LNPGSPAPQAGILIQARRRPQQDTRLNTLEETIINTTIERLRNENKKPNTIKQVGFVLRRMNKQTELLKPDKVKAFIATSQTKKEKPTLNSTKNKMEFCYEQFAKTAEIDYKKTWHKYEPPTPIIPTTDSITKILSTATTKYTTIFSILIETGAEGEELAQTPRKQIDAEQGIISITGTKGHGSASYKLKTATAEMLRIYLHKHPEEYPFPRAKIIGQVWIQTRTRASKKLCQPELNNIPLKNLRNYSGAQLYYKLPDPIAVMRHLRHKKLETTMHYIRGITLNGEEEYTCKTASNTTEAMKLIEAGFTFIQTIDGIHLYRKRK
jgi:integrase